MRLPAPSAISWFCRSACWTCGQVQDGNIIFRKKASKVAYGEVALLVTLSHRVVQKYRHAVGAIFAGIPATTSVVH